MTGGTIAGVGLGLWIASGMMNIYARYFHFPERRLQADTRLMLFAVAIAAVRRAVGLAPAAASVPNLPPRSGLAFWSALGCGIPVEVGHRTASETEILKRLNERS